MHPRLLDALTAGKKRILEFASCMDDKLLIASKDYNFMIVDFKTRSKRIDFYGLSFEIIPVNGQLTRLNEIFKTLVIRPEILIDEGEDVPSTEMRTIIVTKIVTEELPMDTEFSRMTTKIITEIVTYFIPIEKIGMQNIIIFLFSMIGLIMICFLFLSCFTNSKKSLFISKKSNTRIIHAQKR